MTQPTAPAAGGAEQPGAVAAPQAAPQLPTEEQMLAALDDKGKAGPVAQPGEEKKDEKKPEPAADDDPDGDKAFEKESATWQMPEGLKKRLTKLTEDRNKAREAAKSAKDIEFFKPYANDKGKQYLSTLVEFDGLLEAAFENNPWLAELVKHVVVEGKGSAADKAKVLQLVGEAKAEAAAEAEAEAGAGEGSNDPRDKQLKELLDWKKGQEAAQRQTVEAAKRREAVDREKEAYRSEISDFHTKNPQFKDDKAFTRLALQVSAARNISFTDAAKEIADYMGAKEKAALTQLARADQERGGAAVEQPGRGGVPVKERPAIGSDEEAAAMEQYFGGGKP